MTLNRIVVLCVGVVLLAGLSGCIFSPAKKPPTVKPPPIYPQLVNPFDVLLALSMAYENKDSTEISLIYDSQYIGTSFDQIDNSTLTFTKADEVHHVAALAKIPDITSVAFRYPPSQNRYDDLADPPGWATIQFQQDVHVEINVLLGTSYFLFGSGETIIFKFLPTPDSSSPTDTTWKIIRWSETHQ